MLRGHPQPSYEAQCTDMVGSYHSSAGVLVICVTNQNKIPQKDIVSPLQGNTIKVESVNNVAVSVPGATIHTGSPLCLNTSLLHLTSISDI